MGDADAPGGHRRSSILSAPLDVGEELPQERAFNSSHLAIADDLAHGRAIGKEHSDRQVSGNLTGFARVKFDVPGQRPQRFRLIYRQLDDITREVVAIGPRDEHAIYLAAVRRLTP